MARTTNKRRAGKGRRRAGRRRITFTLGFLAGCFLLLCIWNWPKVASDFSWLLHIYVKGAYTLPNDEVIGIDISKHQRDIEWNSLLFHYLKPSRTLTPLPADESRKVDFVYAKASEGIKFTDSRYSENREACKKIGIPFGAYHYFLPGYSPKGQAAHFLSVASPAKGDLLPVLDVESEGDLNAWQLQDAVLEWLKAVEKACGKKPIIYTYIHFYDLYFDSVKEFEDYRFWLAAYDRDISFYNYTLWQQTENGKVGGINTSVDVDVFNGSPSDFNAIMFI